MSEINESKIATEKVQVQEEQATFKPPKKFQWRVADTHSPPEIYNWRLYACIFLGSILGCFRGTDEGLIGPAVVQTSFRNLFGLNDPDKSADEIANLKSNITSMVQLGSIGGALIAMYVVDKFGRIRSLQAICFFWIISVIIQITARSIGQLYAGRLLEGVFTVGLTTTIGPLYTVEITPKAIRGLSNCCFAGAVYFGIMLGYFANYGTALHISGDSNNQWMVPFSIKIMIGGLTLLGSLIFSIESPRWYIKVGKTDKAVEALCRLRNLKPTHPYIVGEITDITELVQQETEATRGNNPYKLMIELFSKKSLVYRFVVLAILIQFLGQWSGANAITIYAPELLSYAGIEGVELFKMTAILGVVKFVSAYLSAFFLIDALGRRKALYTGITVQMVAVLYFAIFLVIVPQAAKNAELTSSQEHAAKASIAALYLGGVGWTMGFNAMQYLVGPEIFPLHIRSFAQSATMVFHFGNQYGNSKAVPKMLLSLQPFGTFFFFVGVNLLSLLWAYFCIPELSGRSLESMEDLFQLPWYLIGRKGHILCPDYSEINKIDYSTGKFKYLDEKPVAEHDEVASHRDSEDKDDDY